MTMKKTFLFFSALLVLCFSVYAQPAQIPAKPYTIIIKGGHVIDPKNKIDQVMDVAISQDGPGKTGQPFGGKIALIAKNIDPTRGAKIINAKGLYVTPGLVDMHVHVFAGTNGAAYMDAPLSLPPDGFTFRSGVTTVGDAGSSGWRTFPIFKKNIIDKAETRVLAFLNIVGDGMGDHQDDVNDMDPDKAAETAIANRKDIVGFKVAHFNGNQFIPIDKMIKAARTANLPAMIDFNALAPVSTIEELFTKKFIAGDIYTHMFHAGTRAWSQDVTYKEPLVANGKVKQFVIDAQKKGIVFDVGQGGNGFVFSQAIPALKQGFYPNSISTDLHNNSMNAGMKDMTNIMSKFLNMGMSLNDVILRSTWNPAKQMKKEELGSLSVGSDADVAILNVRKGDFGFVDSHGYMLKGTQKIEAELTIRSGKIVWDLNGLSATPVDPKVSSLLK